MKLLILLLFAIFPCLAADILIATTVSGNFFGFNVDSGKLLWSASDQFGQVVNSRVPGDIGSADNDIVPIVYIPEISQEGHLLISSRERALTSLGMSLADLVAQSPFETPEGALYVGSKEAKLLQVNVENGYLHRFSKESNVAYGKMIRNMMNIAYNGASENATTSASQAVVKSNDANSELSNALVNFVRTDYKLLIYHVGKTNFYYNISLARYTAPNDANRPIDLNIHAGTNGLFAFTSPSGQKHVHKLDSPVVQGFVYENAADETSVSQVWPPSRETFANAFEAYVLSANDSLYALPAHVYAFEVSDSTDVSLGGSKQSVVSWKTFYERHGYLKQGLLPQSSDVPLLLTSPEVSPLFSGWFLYALIATVAAVIVPTAVYGFKWKNSQQHKSPLHITETVLGTGSHGTVVFAGTFQSRAVAVKRVLLEFFDVASNEITLLQQVDRHPNVIRYFWTEVKGHFCYIALEKCEGTLVDLIEGRLQLPGDTGISPKEMCWQVGSGLAHLHGLKLVHRDLKPHNILVAKGAPSRLVLSDLGLSKRFEENQSSFLQSTASSGSASVGTNGWRAPETYGTEKLKVSGVSDMFSLGCVWYFILSHGSHPFGSSLQRESQIVSGTFCLDCLDVENDPRRFFSSGSSAKYVPPHMLFRTFVSERTKLYADRYHGLSVEETVLARDIISRLLEQDTAKRIQKLDVILVSPLFWIRHKRLSFLQDVSDRYEVEPRGSSLCNALEGMDKRLLINYDWTKSVDAELIDDLTRYRKYHGNSIRDLLRVIRNKKHHYGELPLQTQRLLGPLPDGFYDYFSNRFPYLLLYIFKLVESNDRLKNESIFKKAYLM